MTFLPKLFQDRGYAPGAYGAITSVYMGATAFGGLAGGVLADRWGRLRLILWSLLLAVLPMYYYPVVTGPIIYPIVFLAGGLNGASFSVVVVLAQSLLPSRRAFASGLTLGFMFASGSVGSYLFGLAADIYPLSHLFLFLWRLLPPASVQQRLSWFPLKWSSFPKYIQKAARFKHYRRP